MTAKTSPAAIPEADSAGHAGEEAVLDVGPVAHGGHCVARHEGRVVFVRHAIPGERVRVRLTDAGEDAKFWRADTIEVLDASPDSLGANAEDESAIPADASTNPDGAGMANGQQLSNGM